MLVLLELLAYTLAWVLASNLKSALIHLSCTVTGSTFCYAFKPGHNGSYGQAPRLAYSNHHDKLATTSLSHTTLVYAGLWNLC